MTDFCDLSMQISEVEKLTKDELSLLRMNEKKRKRELMEMSLEPDSKTIIPRVDGCPELALMNLTRMKPRKLSKRLACDAWDITYKWEKLEPLLQGGNQLTSAISTTLKDMLDSMKEVPTQYVNVVMKGSKQDTDDHKSLFNPSQEVIDACVSLWKLKCRINELEKNKKKSVGALKKRYKELEPKVKLQLEQIEGLSKEVPITGQNSSVFLRKKVSKIPPPKMDTNKLVDSLMLYVEALMSSKKDNGTLPNNLSAETFPEVERTQLSKAISEVFENHTKQGDIKWKDRVVIECNKPPCT